MNRPEILVPLKPAELLILNLDDVVVPAWEEHSSLPPNMLTYPELTLRDVLTCMSEEAGEIVTAIGKIMRFGWARNYGSYGPNWEKLAGECGDLAALTNLLRVPGSRFEMLRRIALEEKIRNIANHKKAFLAEGRRT